MSDQQKTQPEEDASRKEVIYYAFGNIEGALANQFFNVLQNIMVVAMHINPLIIGVILAMKTFWDSITDPIMAYITDNTKSRWGRRKPYILVGGVLRIFFLLMIVIFFPEGDQMTSNVDLARDKSSQANEFSEKKRVDKTSKAEKGDDGVLKTNAGLAEKILDKEEISLADSKTSWMTSILEGYEAFMSLDGQGNRRVVLFILISFLIFTTLTTVQSVPYYALGIELSPSYDGRTQVVTYRSIMDKIAGMAAPWVPVFCFMTMFDDAIDGLFWVAILTCLIGIPSTILMVMKTKERAPTTVKKKNSSLLKAMWQTMCNVHFLKIFALYWLIGMTNGIFAQLGFYLNVYWITRSALDGAQLGAYVSMLAFGLSFCTLPLINWACMKFQKHTVLIASIIWMAIGTALKWWCMDPEHPEYQFVLPIFFSVGIAAVFTVLASMMADVTDMDELSTGERREGMFGAVMAFLMKIVSTLTPILAGLILVLSGFDPSLEYQQTEETIFNMRVFYSFVPAVMLLFSLVLLYKYPLSREKMRDVKEELYKRRAAQL